MNDFPTDAELKQRYWEHCGVPRRHAEALGRIDTSTEAGQKWARARDAARDALADGGLCALLGSRGVGKSQIAACLIHETIYQRRRPAMYRRACDVFLELRRTFDVRGTSEADVLGRMERTTLLVVDEAHERANSDFEARTLTALVDRRYGDRKATLFVSNQTPEAFAASVGPSIADRIRESGKIIVCEWASFREPQGPVVLRIK